MIKQALPAILILAANPSWAQQQFPAEISVHPPSPALDEPFFVRLAGVFPTFCHLEGNSFSTVEGDGRLTLTLHIESIFFPCPPSLAELERSFGAFRLNAAVFGAGETVEIVFRTDQSEAEHSVEVTVAESGQHGAITPQSGMYWDPSFPGNGVALEAHGSDLFLAAFTYDEIGVATWRVAQGAMSNRQFEGQLLAFAVGSCLLCGTLAPAMQTGEAVPVQLVFEGGQAAFLGIGAEPGRALELRPFAQRLVQSEPTIAAETFVMADLGGRWLFTDADAGALHLVTELAQAPSGGADTGLAFFASPDRGVTVECGQAPGPAAFSCNLFVDEQHIGVASASDVSHNFIRGDTFLGVRLE